MKKYPAAKPYIGAEEIKAVTAVLKSGQLSLGPLYKKFERAFAKTIGTRYACAVSNGTAGLHLAMIAANIKPGDEVITTPFSFISSANCIEYVGAKPVFVDIDPVTYNIDPKKIESKITKKTKAIVVVHIFGQTAEMDPIVKIAKRHQLTIIEDACEAVNATYNKKKAGTFGQSAVFAFYPNKQMTTGEGGMIVTNDQRVYQLCASLRNQGRTDDLQWLNHRYLGYNYRLNEMSAALGLVQLKKLNRMIAQRKKIAGWYTKYLLPQADIIAVPQTAAGNAHTWFVYVARILKKNVNRDVVIKKMAQQGISTKPYLPSIHLFDFYRQKYHYRPNTFPVSEWVSNTAIALPFYIGLNENDIKHITHKLITTIKKYGK